MEARSEDTELVRRRTADGRPTTEHRGRPTEKLSGRRSPVTGRLKNMGMRIGTEMPRLDGATEWFGGTQAHAEMEAKGHPTLVHFWSMSCGMCKENLPRIAEWREQLREQGLRVIAVHMPRYETDTDVE